MYCLVKLKKVHNDCIQFGILGLVGYRLVRNTPTRIAGSCRLSIPSFKSCKLLLSDGQVLQGEPSGLGLAFVAFGLRVTPSQGSPILPECSCIAGPCIVLLVPFYSESGWIGMEWG